jgi:hypothetical protein
MSRVEVIGNATLYNADCRDILPKLGRVDAVIADLPYGTTAAAWDVRVPFDELWAALDAVTDRTTPIVLFGAEPFSSLLRVSNLKWFRYDWVWEKPKATGFLNAKKRPLVAHEMVSVFSKGPPAYFPQKTTGHPRKVSFRGKHLQTGVYGDMNSDYLYDSTERYPRSVIEFAQDTQNTSVHDTQKPVGLMEYLVTTYSDGGGTILDPTMGSGTTGIACLNKGRKFIGIEKDPTIFEVAVDRFRSRFGPMFMDTAA